MKIEVIYKISFTEREAKNCMFSVTNIPSEYPGNTLRIYDEREIYSVLTTYFLSNFNLEIHRIDLIKEDRLSPDIKYVDVYLKPREVFSIEKLKLIIQRNLNY